MRASSNVRVVKGSSSPSSRSSSSGVSHCLWLGAYLVWVEIKSYEAPPDANSASICSLRSGCVGATTVSTLRSWITSNSARRVYRGSYIGPPTSKAFKLPLILRSLLCGLRRPLRAFCAIFLIQPLPEHPRPAHVLGKPLPRLGVRAPGVRVPVTQYRSHRFPSRPTATGTIVEPAHFVSDLGIPALPRHGAAGPHLRGRLPRDDQALPQGPGRLRRPEDPRPARLRVRHHPPRGGGEPR